MKSTKKWILIIFLVLCGLLFLFFSPDPEVEIKSVSFKDPIAEMVESKGIECIAEEKDMVEEVKPTEEIQVFSLLLSPEKLLYTADKSNDTEVEKVYWLGIGNKKTAKYVQKFSYEENGEKFKVGDYNTENGSISVAFYRIDPSNYGLCALFAGIPFTLAIILSFMTSKDKKEEKVEDLEKKKKEDDENENGGGGDISY